MLSKKLKKGRYWDLAWSLISGCTPVSSACNHCWLAAIDYRFDKDTASAMNGVPYFHGTIKVRHDRLDIPVSRKKPTVWAVWSDLFHESVPDDFIASAYARMRALPQYTFLVLTKRTARMAEYMTDYEHFNFGRLPDHIWSGATVENQEVADERIPNLLKVRGKRFLSVEPMIGPVDLSRHPPDSLSAVICGCESGPKRRETRQEWIINMRDQCSMAGIPFLLKQMDVCGKVQLLPAIDGYIHDAMPWKSSHGKP